MSGSFGYEDLFLYKAFEKQLEDMMVSSAFQPELWNALWHGKGVSKPRREARQQEIQANVILR